MSVLIMEMPEQAASDVYSQMLQMFPNIPQEIIWTYVQRYPCDVKKCVQMLNLQNGKYVGPQFTALDYSKNLNELHKVLQPLTLSVNSGIMSNNNNFPVEDSLYSEQTEHSSYDSHSSYSASLVSPNVVFENISRDSHSKPSTAINFNEPLILDILPDDEGISHSWRPNASDDALCSDFFIPFSASEKAHQQSNQDPNLNFLKKYSAVCMNPGVEEESGRYSMTPQMLYEYASPSGRNYGKDVASYLHYQKSQMNVVRYEVIKAKIELSNVKETVENLERELKEKMESKSVQDIVELNKEIEELRLDCQCLCSDIDCDLEDPILLGEVDERIYEKNKSSAKSAVSQSATSCLSTSSCEIETTDSQDESGRWQCSKCTFANHPAINVCEMCQLPKSIAHRPSVLPIPPTSCYCHPKENSLPVQS